MALLSVNYASKPFSILRQCGH